MAVGTLHNGNTYRLTSRVSDEPKCRWGPNIKIRVQLLSVAYLRAVLVIWATQRRPIR
jgi:hypothetical protein